MTAKTNTILIVDDEVINLRMLERLLCSRYSVLTATNGLAALEILKQLDISLLISDQRMPGMTGIELLRASRDIDPDLVCMLVTANTDEDTSIEAINDAGALRVIHKPWKGQTLLQFVEETLAQRETLIECKQANSQIELALSQLKLAAEELSQVSKQQ
jgi:response regulator RpfG family c-di-GMP phosphodiesterase